eukprot:Pgem_evm1s301
MHQHDMVLVFIMKEKLKIIVLTLFFIKNESRGLILFDIVKNEKLILILLIHLKIKIKFDTFKNEKLEKCEKLIDQQKKGLLLLTSQNQALANKAEGELGKREEIFQ